MTSYKRGVGHAANGARCRLADCSDLAIHLATTAIKARLLGRRERKRVRKTAREFRRNHHFDPKQKRWVRNVDQVALVDHSAEDRRIFLIFIFWLLFILWEGYWVLEIYEQYVARAGRF